MIDQSKLKKALLLSGVTTLVTGAALMTSTAVFAQTATEAAEAELENIVVTGSRIARPNLEQSSPVSVVDSAEIGLRQPVAAEEFLREVPGVVPNIGPGVNNGTNGSAQLDLRGLGSNRNLVLIDGRRVVPATNAGVVDLNLVPVALIERTDVLTGGASSVYGADAIAGVVNFVLKSDFTGLDSTSTIGLAEEGDGRIFRTDLTIGASLADGRGNVVVSIGYSDTQPILQGDRPWGRESLSSVTGNPQGSATATPATILFPFTGRVNPNGTFDVGVTSNYNFNPLNVYQTPLERFSAFSKANYKITDDIEVYAQAMYVRSIVDQQIAPSGTFFSNINVPLSNPFLTAAQRNTICANFDTNTTLAGLQPITQANCDAAALVTTPTAAGYIEVPMQIGRRFTEAGPRQTNFSTNTFQFTAGLRGSLTESLDWDVYASYGESERTNTSSGQGLRSRLQQALRARNATTCVDASNGCVPINLFGGEGTITPAMFNFLNVASFNFIEQKFSTVQGLISGDVGFSSPFASEPIGVAIGAEYRQFKGASGGDGLSVQAGEILGAGAAALPIRGEYDTHEIFGEIIAPLVQDRPFVHSLTLEGGFRYSNYSTSGENWTYKIGGSYSPIPDIRFRGNYARSVRAPNLGELFQPQVTQLSNRAVDPCQLALPTGNATLRAICERQLQLVGAPTSLIGSIQPPTAGQINVTSGGNLNLDPEKADTYTIGVVLQPSFVPRLSLTFDYYNIKLKDAITTPSQADVIDACFAQADPNNAQCLLIRRNPLTGQLSGPNDTTFGPFLGLSNLGKIETTGIDFSLLYTHELDFVTLNFSFVGNYTITSKFQATPTSINRECTGYYSVSCASIQPDFSSQFRTTASFDSGTDVTLRWRYISGVAAEPGVAVLAAFSTIPATSYFDLALAQEIGEHLRLTLSVDNLFDKKPKVVGNTIGSTSYNSGNVYPSTYDAIGRKYRLGVNVRF